MSLQRSVRDKPSLIAFLRSRGIEPDLRQENRSLSFAVFPVASPALCHDLAAMCSSLKSHFIQVTARHKFGSPLRAFTFSPYLSEVGPRRPYAIKLSHRPSEMHVFASAVLSVPAWREAGLIGRWETLLLSAVACIEAVRSDWLSEEDRANFMFAVLSAQRS
jgi:hypothetical protein